jgi:hypothetical protein
MSDTSSAWNAHHAPAVPFRLLWWMGRRVLLVWVMLRLAYVVIGAMRFGSAAGQLSISATLAVACLTVALAMAEITRARAWDWLGNLGVSRAQVIGGVVFVAVSADVTLRLASWVIHTIVDRA